MIKYVTKIVKINLLYKDGSEELFEERFFVDDFSKEVEKLLKKYSKYNYTKEWLNEDTLYIDVDMTQLSRKVTANG